MELNEAIQSRRSIRKFKTDPIPENYITELIEAGRLAPSGSNLQSTRYVIIKSEEARAKFAECTPLPFVTQAPLIIACCINKKVLDTAEKRSKELMQSNAFADTPLANMNRDSETYNKRRREMDEESLKSYLSLNAAIALEHIALRAVDLGLGSCWIMMFDREKAKKILELDERYDVVALLPIGYPDQNPPQRPRLELNELVIQTI
ncbi:nitroreductase family protein [Sedimentibacter sp. MB31-C6]|uniref:nitroreductase family protein n=1 Tax=Sedimentibacter sp. MB31-C6 TaxID=3109366 RepID=UPI00289E4D16|nr:MULTISPECIES: nitroreductase family protein [unclassified Sedimentibacter]WSI03083.1 nitroreductase family protein [Sedimentibacter sp. MB36-C1]